MGRFLRSAVLVFMVASAISAQQYSFREYGQDAGLANLDLCCLIQDRTGFLWLGTDNGLYRYDGRQFRAYKEEQGLPSVQVASLHQTADGDIWVGTLRGLARLKGEKFETVLKGSGNGALAIASDALGTLYVGSARGLLVAPSAAAGGKREFRLHPAAGDGGVAQHVWGIAVESPQRVWYGCGSGICRLDEDRARILEGFDVPSETWKGFLIDRQGSLWARSYSGLIVLARGARKFVRQDAGLPHAARTPSVTMDRDGEIWVPTARGLARRTVGGWQLIGKANGLSSGAVNAFFQDREGAAWLALDGAGLVRWRGYKTAETWTESDGLSHDVVWSLRRDSGGTLWASTQGGLSRYLSERRRWQPLTDPVVGDGGSMGLTPGPDGKWFTGQTPGGLIEFDPRTRKTRRYGAASGLLNEWIYSLAADGEGRLWVGTGSGLYLGKPREGDLRFERVPFPGDNSKFVLAVLADSRGRVWASTSAGLSRLENGAWRHFKTEDGLLHNNITYLTEAPDHAVWVGYRDPIGISRLDADGEQTNIRHYGVKDGLTKAKTYFLRFDRRGWLWVGTDMGVDYFDGAAWRHLDKADGMVVNDCDHNAFFDDEDGSVWIGTSKGLTHLLHPATAAPRPVSAPVVITWLRHGDTVSPLSGGAKVPYARRSFSAGFAALTYVNEHTVRFRHRLLGLDSAWTETRQAEAQYAGLPPGHFTFEVEAGTVAGKWNQETARVSFRVLPPWWLSWWAISASVVLVGSAARLVWAWRVRSILSRQMALERAVEDRTHRLAQEKARLEREKAIVENQKLEIERLLHESQQAARVKSEFLANISHELRTPLNGIMGMTDLVLETILDADQTDYLQLVKSSADSLLVLINDILDFSKIEAGRMDLVCEEFDLAKLMREVLGPVAMMARRKGLEVRGFTPAAPMRMVGDPVRLRQVLTNLAGNAVKFTETGSIEITAGEEEDILPPGRRHTDHSRRIHFRLRDTGIGIAPEKQALIFEPFQQADGSTTRRFGGTGLGLSICGRLVALMGGRIWVESEPGVGSTFHFTVPVPAVRAAAADVPAAAPAENKMPPTAGLRVLVAEDNAVNQKLAKRMLETAGCTVVSAMDGREAVAACTEHQFDVVLMDLQMPHMDGFEATAELRRRESISGIRTPIVALTANAMNGDRERCLAAGMDGYVAKPMKRAELFQAIADSLETNVA